MHVQCAGPVLSWTPCSK